MATTTNRFGSLSGAELRALLRRARELGNDDLCSRIADRLLVLHDEERHTATFARQHVTHTPRRP